MGTIQISVVVCTVLYKLYTKLQVDGQSITMFVDTGSSHLSVIWKDWLESVTQPGYCNDFKPGCYKCPTVCQPHEPYEVIGYEDGVKAEVFQHRGHLTVAGFPLQDAIFGLIMEQDPSPTISPPLSILGLSPSIDSNFPSLIAQFLSMPDSPVVNDIFALYLKYPQTVTSPCIGRLLLGGGDPSLYQKPLAFVEMTDDIEYMVSLNTLKVGDGVLTIGINHNALFDTGSTFMCVPQLYINHLVDEVATKASNAAGRPVAIRFDYSRKSWIFDCENFKYMPTMVFGLGPKGAVPLVFSPINYVLPVNEVCRLIFKPGVDNTLWTFPSMTLIGNYIEFNPSLQEIGIARLA